MKYFCVIFSVLAVASATLTWPNGAPYLEGVKHARVSENMNTYLDQMLEMVGPWLAENNMNPMKLPELVKSFSCKPIFITYHGEMSLRNGELYNISDILRRGDAFMTTDDNKIRIEASIAVSSIEVTYDYLAQFMGLGPKGNIYVHSGGIVIEGDVGIEIGETLHITLNDLKISSISFIDIKLSGNILIDWLGNAFLKVVTSMFKEQITGLVSDKVRDAVQNLINDINTNKPDVALRLLQAATT